MKILHKAPDGGKGSGVTGYFLIEWKALFSIVLLRFSEGTREAFHSHAFNAVTVWLKGFVCEYHRTGERKLFVGGMIKYTPREVFHKIEAHKTTWAISFRGPWKDRWEEDRRGKRIVLTHGRREVPA